jgi:hypothetical protein
MLSRTVCAANGLRGERLHDLEGAREAEARVEVRRLAGDVVAVEADSAFVGLEKARHQREQRRLAGAVGPDQRAERAARQTQAHLLHRAQAAERDRHAGQLEQRVSHGGLRASAPAARRRAPPGRVA